MNRHPSQHDDSWESDPVWKLLDAAPPLQADPRFAERTVRAARLAGAAGESWWRKLVAPSGIAGLTAATAAIVLALFGTMGALDDGAPPDRHDLVDRENVGTSSFAVMQEAAEAEALMVAVEQLDDFSDHELVHLIGL